MALELWRNSPDLNPIENRWIWMKKQLYSQFFTSITELKEAIKVLWFERTADSEHLVAGGDHAQEDGEDH